MTGLNMHANSTVMTHLVVPNYKEARAFYEKVFGAEADPFETGPEGKVWHGEVRIQGTTVHLMESFPDMGLVARDSNPRAKSRETDHQMNLVVTDDVDGVFKRAIEYGAVAVIEPHDAFWGSRYAEFRAPDGHRWSLSPRKGNSPEERQQLLTKFVHENADEDGPLRSPARVVRADKDKK